MQIVAEYKAEQCGQFDVDFYQLDFDNGWHGCFALDRREKHQSLADVVRVRRLSAVMDALECAGQPCGKEDAKRILEEWDARVSDKDREECDA